MPFGLLGKKAASNGNGKDKTIFNIHLGHHARE